MKRIIASVLLFTMTFFFEGCYLDKKNVRYFEMAQGYENVSEILIVQAGLDYWSNCTVLKHVDISVAEKLFNELENFPLHKYGTNMSYPVDRCFIIIYENGEADVFSKCEPHHWKYDKDGNLQGTISWLCVIDEDINKYDNIVDYYMNYTL